MKALCILLFLFPYITLQTTDSIEEDLSLWMHSDLNAGPTIIPYPLPPKKLTSSSSSSSTQQSSSSEEEDPHHPPNQGRRAQAKASWDPKYDGYMDQRRPNPKDKYIYQGPLFDIDAALNPIQRSKWFEGVRQGYVPDFLCPNDRFIRYWKSCPQDLTALAYWSTGYMPYILRYTNEELEAIGLGGFEPAKFNSSQYFSCIRNCTNGLVYQTKIDVPYGFNRLCFIPDDDYAACPLKFAVCPLWSKWNTATAQCECQTPLVFPNLTSRTCRCPYGQFDNGTGICYNIECDRGQRLLLDDCVKACPYYADYNYTDGRCVCRRSEKWISTPFNISGSPYPWDMTCIKEPTCPTNYFWDDPNQCTCPYVLAPDGVCATSNECSVNGGTITNGTKSTCLWDTYSGIASDSLRSNIADWIEFGIKENAGKQTYTYTLPSVPASGATIRVTIDVSAVLKTEQYNPSATILRGSNAPVKLSKLYLDLDNTARSGTVVITPVNNPLVTGDYIVTLNHTVAVISGRDVRYSFVGGNNTIAIGSASFALLDTSVSTINIFPSSWARNDALGTLMQLSTEPNQTLTYSVTLGSAWALIVDASTPLLRLKMEPSDPNVKLIPSELIFRSDNVTDSQTVNVVWNSINPPPTDTEFTIVLSAQSTIPEYQNVTATIYGITTTQRSPVLTRTSPADILPEGKNVTYAITLDGRAPPRGTSVSVLIGYTVVGNISPEFSALISSSLSITPSLLTLGIPQLGNPQTITVSYPRDLTYTGEWSITLTHTVSCSDPMFSQLTLPDILLSVSEVDSTAIIVSSSRVLVNESKAAEFTVALSSKPLVSVTVTFSVDGPMDAYRNVSSVTIDRSAWLSPRTVRVETIDNEFASGERTLTINGDITGYGVAVTLPPVNIVILDDDLAKVRIIVVPKPYSSINATTNVAYTENNGIQLTETRSADMARDWRGVVDYATSPWASSFTVALGTQPLQDLQIEVTTDKQTQIAYRSGRISPYSLLESRVLTFTSVNWNTPQVVYIAAYDDDIDETRIISNKAEKSHSGTITVSVLPPYMPENTTLTRETWSDIAYLNASNVKVPAAILDNDNVGIEIAYDYMFFIDNDNGGIVAYNTTWTVLDTPALYSGINIGEMDMVGGVGTSLYYPSRTVRPDVKATASYAIRLTSQPYSFSGGATSAATLDPRSPPSAIVNLTITNTFKMCAFSDGRFPETITRCTTDSNCSSIRNLITDRNEVGICTNGPTINVVSPNNAILSFTTDNWNQWTWVQVSSINNNIDDTGMYSDFLPSQLSHKVEILAGANDRIDTSFTNLQAIANVSIFDDDVSGAQLYNNNGESIDSSSLYQLVLAEGNTGKYALTLSTRPRTAISIVRADLGSTGNAALTFSPSLLNFNASNWNIPQYFTVTALQNYIDEGKDSNFTVLHEIVVPTNVNEVDVFYRSLSRSQLPRVPLTITNDDTAGVLITPVIIPGSTSSDKLNTNTITHVLYSLTSQPTLPVEIRVNSLLDGVLTSLCGPNADPGSALTIFNADGDILSSYTSTLRDNIRLVFDASSWSIPQGVGLVLSSSVANNKANVSLVPSIRFPSGTETVYSRVSTRNLTFSRLIESTPAYRVSDTTGKAIRVEESSTNTITTVGFTTPVGSSLNSLSTVYIYAPQGHCLVRGVPMPSLFCNNNNDCTIYDSSSTCLSNTKISVSPTTLTMASQTGSSGSFTNASFDIYAFDDAFDEGSPHHALLLFLSGGATPTTNGATIIGSASVLIADNDGAGIRTTPLVLNISESNSDGSGSPSTTYLSSMSYSISLRTPPTGSVTVTPKSVASTPVSGTILSFSPSFVTFTSSNYDTLQNITITAPRDWVRRSGSVLFNTKASHTLASTDPKYSGTALKSTDVSCNIYDIDIASIVVEVAGNGLVNNSITYRSLNVNELVQIIEGTSLTNLPVLYISLGSIPSTGTIVIRLSASIAIFPSTVNDVTSYSFNKDLIFDTSSWSTRTPVALGVINDNVDRGVRSTSIRIAPLNTAANLLNTEYSTTSVTVSSSIIDDDIASLIIRSAGSSTAFVPTTYNMSEGQNISFTVSISSVPADGTTVIAAVNLTSAVNSRSTLLLDPGSAVLSIPAVLTWTPSTANRTFNLTLVANDNTDADGKVDGTLSIGLSSRTTDPIYTSKNNGGAINVSSTYLQIFDDDVQGVLSSLSTMDLIKPVTNSTAIPSSNTAASQVIGLRLGARPSGTTITVTPRIMKVDGVDVTSSRVVVFNPSSITFDSSTWSTSTEIRITALGTPDKPTPSMQSLVISFDTSDSKWLSSTLSVRVFESVNAGFVLSNTPATLSEGLDTNLRIMMATQPSSGVSYVARIVKGTMIQSDVQVKSTGTRGSFNITSWQTPIIVPISFTDDSFAGLQENVTLCLAVTSNMTLYDNRDYCIALRLLDNDEAGYTITILSGANITNVTTSSGALSRAYSFTEGASAIFNFKLTSVPRAQVSLTISSDNGALVPFSPATLTFTSATTDGLLTLVKITDDNVLNIVRSGSFRVSATPLNSAGTTDGGGVFDTAYASITQPHLYTIVDDDASRAALSLTLSPEAQAVKGVMAEGTSVTATLAISVAPGSTMVVPIRLDVIPSFNGIVQVNPSYYEFNRTSFQPVTVTITAVRDFMLSDSNIKRISTISAVSTTSTVMAYVGAVSNTSVTITEVDAVGWVSRPGRAAAIPGAVSIVPAVLYLPEGSGFSTYTLTLSSLPSSPVPIAILYSRGANETNNADDNGLIITVFSAAKANLALAGTYTSTSTSPILVTFDKDNWASGFLINVTAPGDSTIEGRVKYEINHYVNAGTSTSPALEYSTLLPFKQIVSVTDSGLAVSSSVLRLTEESRWTTNTTYTLRLMVPPTSTQVVDISVFPSDSRVSISPSSVTFEPNSASSAVITVNIANDFVADPERTVTITHQTAEDKVTVDLTIVDDDVPSLLVMSPFMQGRDPLVNRIARIDEGSINAPAFALKLGSRPSADVNISFTEVYSSTATQPLLRTINTITIPASAWNTAINISLSAARDNRATADRTTSITMSVSSRDPNYSNAKLVIPPITVTITNLDTAGIILAGADRKAVIEGAVGLAKGAADTFTIRLSSIPTGTVVIALKPGARIATSPQIVQFTEETWSVPLTVSMSAVDDNYDEGLHTELITLRVDTTATLDTSYISIVLPSITVSITDNDVSALIRSSTALSIGEDDRTPSDGPGVTTAVYSLSLASQPYFVFGSTASITEVTVQLDLWDGYCSVKSTNEPNHDTTCRNDADCNAGYKCSKGARYTVTPSTLTFTNNDWSFPQRITVTAIDDNIAEPRSVISKISHTMISLTDSRYNNLVGGDISVTTWDNDIVGIKVGYTTTSGIARVFVNEDASAATAYGSFTVRLASQPWSTVTIKPWYDPVQVRLAPNQASSIDITPENWNTPVSINLGAIDDLVDEPKPHISLLGYNVTSLDPGYSTLGLSPYLPATSPLYTSIIRVSIMDNDWAGLKYEFRPRSANGNAVVRTTGTDVFFDDSACLNACSSPTSPCPSSLCTSFSGLTTSLILFEGGVGDNYTIALTSRPLAPVTVYIGAVYSDMQGEIVNDTCGDGRTGVPGNQLQVQAQYSNTPGEEGYNTAILKFDSTNWNIPQNVAVKAVDDRVDEGGNQVIYLASFLRSNDGNYLGSTLRGASCSASQSISDSNSHPGLAAAYNKAKTSTSILETTGCPRNPVDPVSATINEDAWAVPAKLSSAFFADDLTSITISFTANTDFAGLTGSFNCSKLLKVIPSTTSVDNVECRGQPINDEVTVTEQLLGSGATCSWASNRKLVVSFGANPTVVTGDQIVIYGRNIRRSPTARIYSFGNVTIQAPSSAIRPTADIGPPAVRVGQCVGASVSVSQSGSGNRPMSYTWSLLSAKDFSGNTIDIGTSTELTNVTAALTDATTNKLSIVRFGPSDWPQGWAITVQVTATNFVGLSGTKQVQLTKAATPVPVILLPSSVSFLRSQPVFVEARSFAPRCPGEPERNASARAMTFYWFDVTNDGSPELPTSDKTIFESVPLVAYGSAAAATALPTSIVRFPIPALSSIPISNNRTRVLSFPSRYLSPSQSYYFKVIAVMDVDPTAYAETTIRVDIVANPLVPFITGGMLVQRTIQQAFTLDASSSYDPAGIATDEITSYAWTCIPNFDRNSILKTAANAAPTKCGSLLFTGITSSSIQIPARSLTPEYYYDFTVTYTVGGENGRSASFTQTVQMVYVSGPTFQVSPPTTYFSVAPGTDRLTISSNFGPAEDMTTLTMVWSQVSGPPVPAVAFLDESVRPLYFATQVNRESLVILPNILNPNSDYSFCLTAASAGAVSTPATSCTSFRTAPVPSGGSLAVAPVGDGSAFTPFRFTVSNVGGEIDAFDFYYITETILPAGSIRDGFATRSAALASWVYVNGRTVGKRFDHRTANDLVFERAVLPEGKLIIVAAPTTRYTTYGILWTTTEVSAFTGTISELLLASSNAAGDGDYLQTGSSVAASASIVSTAGGRLRRLLSNDNTIESDKPFIRRMPPSMFHGRILSSDNSRSLASTTVSSADAAALLNLASIALAQAKNALTASGLIDQISVLRSISTLPDSAMDMNNSNACINHLKGILQISADKGITTPLTGLTNAIGIISDCIVGAGAETALASVRAAISSQLVAGASSDIATGKSFQGQFAKSTLSNLDTLNVHIGSTLSAQFGSQYISFAGASLPQDALTIQILKLVDTPSASELGAGGASTFVAPPIEATLLVSSTNVDAEPAPIPHPRSGEILPVLRMDYYLDGECMDIPGMRYDGRFFNNGEWIRNGTTAIAATEYRNGVAYCKASLYTYHLSQFALVAAPSSRLQVKDTNGALLTPLSSPVVVDENNNVANHNINLQVLLESPPAYPVTVTLATPPGVCYDTVNGQFIRKVVNGVTTNNRVTCDPVSSPCATGVCFQLLASITPTTILFEPAKWQTSITVTLSAPADYYYEGGASVASSLYLEPTSKDDRFDVNGVCVEANADGVCSTRSNNPGLLLPITVKDTFDTAGFILSGASTYNTTALNETDTSSKSYTVKLASKPFSSVTVSYLSNDLTAVGSRGKLLFTSSNYNTPQAVVFTPIDDVIAQGTHSADIVHSIQAIDTVYQAQSISNVKITLLDNDVATIVVSPLSKSTIEETGVSGPITFSLTITSRPMAAVVVYFNTTILTSGISYTNNYPFRFVVDGTVTPSYTFTENNWDTTAVISLVGMRDGEKYGDVDFQLFYTVQTSDPVYAPLVLSPQYDTNFKVKDADNARFSLRQGVPIISAGGTATYTIRLNALPISIVRLYPSVINPNTNPVYPQPLSVSPAMIEFDAATFDQWQTITVTATASDIAFANKSFSISHKVLTGDPEYAALDSPVITFELSQAITPLIIIRPSRINITEGTANGTGQVLVFTNGGKSSYTSIPLGITLLSQPVTTNTLFFSFTRRDMYGPIQLPGASSLLSPYITLDSNTYATGIPTSLVVPNDCIAWNSGIYVGTVTVVNGDPNYVGLSSTFTIQYTDNDINKVGMDVVSATTPVQVPIYTAPSGLVLRVTLRTQPSSTVIVSITSGNARVKVSNTTVIFYPSEFKCVSGVVTSPVKEIILTQSLPQFDSNNAPIPRSSGSTMITLVASGGGDTFYQGQSAFIGVGYAGDPAASMSQTPTPSSTPSTTSTKTETATGTSTASYGTSPSRTPSNTRTPSATRSPVSPTSTATFGSSASPSTVPARALIALALDGVDTVIFSLSVPIQTALKTAITATLPLVRLPIEMLQITEIKRTDEVSGAGINGRLLSNTNNITSVSTVVYFTVLFNNLGAAKELYADIGSADFPNNLADMLMLLDADQGLGGVYSHVSIRVIGNAIVVEPPAPAEIVPEKEPLLTNDGTIGVAVGISAFVLIAVVVGYTIKYQHEKSRKEKLKDIHKFMEQNTQLADDSTDFAVTRENSGRLQKPVSDDKGVGNDAIYDAMDEGGMKSNIPTSPSLRISAPTKTPVRSAMTAESITPRTRTQGFNITSSGKKSIRSLSTDNSKLISPSSLYGEDDEEFEVISPRQGLRAHTIQPTLRSRRISKTNSSNINQQFNNIILEQDPRVLNTAQVSLIDNTAMGTLDFKLPVVPPQPPVQVSSSRSRILTSIPNRNYGRGRYTGNNESVRSTSNSEEERSSVSSYLSDKVHRKDDVSRTTVPVNTNNNNTNLSNATVFLPTMVKRPTTSSTVTNSTTNIRPSLAKELSSGKGLAIKPISVPEDIDFTDKNIIQNPKLVSRRSKGTSQELDIDSVYDHTTNRNKDVLPKPISTVSSAVPPHKRTPSATTSPAVSKRGSLAATTNVPLIKSSTDSPNARPVSRPGSSQPGLFSRKQKTLLTRAPSSGGDRRGSNIADDASYSTESSNSGDDFNSMQMASRATTTSPPSLRQPSNNPFSTLTGNNGDGAIDNKLRASLSTYRSQSITAGTSSRTSLGNLPAPISRVSVQQVGSDSSTSTIPRVSITIGGNTNDSNRSNASSRGTAKAPSQRTKKSPVRIE